MMALLKTGSVIPALFAHYATDFVIFSHIIPDNWSKFITINASIPLVKGLIFVKKLNTCRRALCNDFALIMGITDITPLCFQENASG
jgi:hypothetical protein